MAAIMETWHHADPYYYPCDSYGNPCYDSPQWPRYPSYYDPGPTSYSYSPDQEAYVTSSSNYRYNAYPPSPDEFQFKWAKVLKFSENKAVLNLLLSASVMDEKNSFHQPGMSGVVKTSATLRTPSTVNAVKKKQMLRIQEMIKKK